MIVIRISQWPTIAYSCGLASEPYATYYCPRTLYTMLVEIMFSSRQLRGVVRRIIIKYEIEILNSQPIFKIKSTITTFASTMKTIINIFLCFSIKLERKPIHFNINDLCMGENNVEIYIIEKRKTHEKNTKKRSEINK